MTEFIRYVYHSSSNNISSSSINNNSKNKLEIISEIMHGRRIFFH